MKRRIMILFAAGVVVLAVMVGWRLLNTSEQTVAGEQSVTLIPLEGTITKDKAELSGLTWAGETLILLPQYPEKFGPGDGALFAISKQEILDRLDGKSNMPIIPSKIKFEARNLRNRIHNYEGFESIAIWNDNVYLTIESGKDSRMMGYIVSGTISADGSQIVLNDALPIEIKPAVQMDNRTDEAIVTLKGRIFTFFEVNGAGLNPQPQAHIFNTDLTPAGTSPFPRLEYRVTDAAVGTDGEIWALNALSPQDTQLITKNDPLLETYGLPTPIPAAAVNHVERLVKLNYSKGVFELDSAPPIKLALEKDWRNWEGLVLLDKRGFLLATDKHPGTLLGFVPLP